MGNNNTKNYFCVTALEDGVTITTDAPIKYKINNNAWNSITNTNGGEIILSKTGDKAYFLKNDPNDNNPEWWEPHYGVKVNPGKKRTKVSGNIMSLIHSDDFEQNFYVGEDSFLQIFENSGIVDASELILPSTTLATSCYQEMFYGCTSLTSAPELPAAKLASYCYHSMFNGCTSLTEAPELPAKTLAEYCYSHMFEYCESLVEAPKLPATTLFKWCYTDMFAYCFSLTKAPDLNATTLAERCYNNMFYSCTNLLETPAILPATTLFEYCYSHMFKDCILLTNTPYLSGMELNDYCYYGMFQNCESLSIAPELPATTLAEYCYYYMFSGCKNLTKAPELLADTLSDYCYAYMFSSCTSLSSSPILGAKKLVPYCYQGMFSGCRNLTEITMLANDMYHAFDALLYWVQSVGKNGNFYKDYRLKIEDETNYYTDNGIIGNGNSTKYDGIPYGWNIDAKDTYLFISPESYWTLTTTTIYNETYEVYTWDKNVTSNESEYPIRVFCMGLDELTLYFKFTNEYDSMGYKQAYFRVSALDDADTIIFDTQNASLPTQNGEPLSEYYSITLTNIDSEKLHTIYITYHDTSWATNYIPTDGIFMVKRMTYQ
jgi:hypothetical protein